MTTTGRDEEKVVVIGGSSGIGRATSLMLAQKGAHVTIAGRRRQPLEAVASRADRIEVRELDLASEASLDVFAQELGCFDALVISAGVRGVGKPFLDAPFSDMAAQIELRLTYTLRAVHRLAPLLSPEGSIVLISGIAARRALANAVALTVTNAGLEAAVLGLAKELAPVRVNAVSPGRLDTGYWDGLPENLRQRMREDAAAKLPVRRIGTAEDVASAVCFLLGHSFITGTVLDCDGGMKLA
ncbi:SDR family oxidoreductase [Nitratireductor sp. ZSWI3]|uniref:SDR family oxidoreductase n=1 Tax=Nitratireductor sp. ZSWI3 TaxID=2966359 RepID=UPI0021501B15|nr:SDR family oxidoreductase [Nitratireductor sp. ZSWI3]MCR4265026.1 SDR family oxidoreductase [Nitratireductor sp. ZSWI3]